MNITMKKALLYTMTLCAIMMGLTACNDDHDALTDSRLTTYPVFDLQGDAFVEVNLGDPYVDAGCKATLGGDDCTAQIVTTGLEDIDTDVAGFYYVNYSLTNAYGFESSVSRTIAVYDPNVTTDLTGEYVTTENSGCYISSSGRTIPLGGMSITLDKVLPGLFNVTDLIGGLYDQYVGYGPDYAMNGVIQLTADNDIVVLNGEVPGWGDSFDVAYSGKYDPETGAITWAVEYAEMYYIEVEIVPVTEEEE